MGRWLAWLEARLNCAEASFAARRAAGVLALCLYLAPVALVAWAATRVCVSGGALGFAVLVLLAASLPSQRSLAAHVGAVAEGLDAGLEEGRRAVAKIVGRNPDVLDEAGVARAAIESLAENFSDGVVAPILWTALGGLIGGALYKAINTADSMIGHRDERYKAFGWAAARLDDLVNLPASRLAALWLILAAVLTPEARRERPRGPYGATRRIIARPTPAGPKRRWPARLASSSPDRASMGRRWSTTRSWGAADARPTPPISGGLCGFIGGLRNPGPVARGSGGYPIRGKRRYRERMMMGWFGRVAIGFAALGLMMAEADARITHLEITKTEPAFGGQSFGDAGSYEHLTGRVTGELDPADPANSGIQDINLAPRNARGMVEYVTNIELVKPTDMARGNRILFFEVNNRGNKLAPGSFNSAVAGGVADRNALSSPGRRLAHATGLHDGVVRVGNGRAAGHEPIGMPPIEAHNHDGSAITGIVRSEIITPVAATSLPISLSQQIQNYPIDSYDSYPTASLDNSTPFADGFLPTLTVRAREQDPREPIPNSAWSFGTCEQGGALTPDEKHVCYRDGFKPGHLYELIYRARIRLSAASDLPQLATSAPSCAIPIRTIPGPQIRSIGPTISPSSKAARRADG